jgi:uncharacterized protein
VIVLYFQDNASSLPPRLPYLSAILKALQVPPHGHTSEQIAHTIIALSYRGFWTSRGRATQQGIELDAQAALKWLSHTILQNDPPSANVKVIPLGPINRSRRSRQRSSHTLYTAKPQR